MWLYRNAELKSEPDRQIYQKYVCGKGIWFYVHWSLITGVTQETHIGIEWSKTRCLVKRIAAVQRCAWRRSCENSGVTLFEFSVFKSALTHACYKIIWCAFLISRTSNWYISYESDSSRDCTYRCTHICMLQKSSALFLVPWNLWGKKAFLGLFVGSFTARSPCWILTFTWSCLSQLHTDYSSPAVG